jgi:hypothetical protein
MTARQDSVMMLMTVVGIGMQCCRADAVDGDQREGRRRDLRSLAVNRACGAVLHSALRAPLRPLRR